MLKTADILRYFDFTVCGDEVKKPKPNPEIFLTAMNALGGTRSNTLVVEDSHNGVRAAGAAGIPVLVVPDMLPPLPELANFAVVNDLDEAKELLMPFVEGHSAGTAVLHRS